MNLPDQDKINQEQFYELLKAVDPNLYALKEVLSVSKTNPAILLAVIRAIGRITAGSGYGKIEIFLTNNMIKNVNSQERVDVNEKFVEE